MNGKQVVLKLLLGFCVLVAALALALWAAVRTNGPAVLNFADGLTAGFKTTPAIKESGPISFGTHPQQRLFVTGSQQNSEANTGRPVLIFIHGGSWSHGDPEDYGFFGRTMARSGHVTVNAGYRLGEDGKYPAMLEDAATAVKWTLDNITDHGGDPEQIFLIGHSAGAYNAVMAALNTRWLEQQDVPPGTIKGVIGLAGPYDFLPLTSDGAKRAFGDEPDLDITQPINFVRSDAPPMLLMTGSADETVKPRNTQALNDALTKLSASSEVHVYPGVSHARIIMNFAHPWASSSDVNERVAEFVGAKTAKR